MRLTRTVPVFLLAVAALFSFPSRAAADVTVFLGANLSPANRQARGLSVGTGLVVIGAELEYSDTTDDLTAGAPSLKTGTASLILQTPVVAGIQPYFITGGGVYHEELGPRTSTGFAVGTGGGLKITLIGPIRLRVDYRVFNLAGGAVTSPAHRVYAGLNVKF